MKNHWEETLIELERIREEADHGNGVGRGVRYRERLRSHRLDYWRSPVRYCWRLAGSGASSPKRSRSSSVMQWAIRSSLVDATRPQLPAWQSQPV
jgi:hypothetical protein